MLHRPRIDLLQAMPIFGALREDTLDFLLARMHEVRVAAGGWFFREGDAASRLFVLEAGSASVLKGWDGARCCCATCRPATASARWR